MEKIYSNALKIEREVAGIKKLGGERKKIVVHGTQKNKVFFKVTKRYINFYTTTWEITAVWLA